MKEVKNESKEKKQNFFSCFLVCLLFNVSNNFSMFYDALYIYFHHTYALCTNEKMEEKNHLEMERMLPATLVFFHLNLFFLSVYQQFIKHKHTFK